jgi:hypothetical protein
MKIGWLDSKSISAIKATFEKCPILFKVKENENFNHKRRRFSKVSNDRKGDINNGQ